MKSQSRLSHETFELLYSTVDAGEADAVGKAVMHPDRRRPCALRCRLDSCGRLENGASNICFGPGEYLNPSTPRKLT